MLTLYPFEFSFGYLRIFASLPKNIILKELFKLGFRDMIANVFLFMPMGFLLRKSGAFFRFQHRAGCALLFGIGISLVIETGQLFLSRSTNFFDIAMNGTGAAIGYWITGYFSEHSYAPARTKAIRSGFILGYLVFIGALLIYPAFENRTRWWKPWYPVVIGNEADSTRPWLGELYHVSIYPEALKPDQVRTLFQHRDEPNPKFRNEFGAILNYPLTEGHGNRLHDRSGFGKPIPLIGDSIAWLPTGGIRCKGSLIRSKKGGDKIVYTIDSTQQFSVEVWMKPDNLTQGGPARIFTLSPDVNRRNFTLAQEGQEFRFRVRSQHGGWNGSEINLKVSAVFKSIVSYHLVATFNRGTEQLFVNGKRHPKVLFTHFDYLPEIAGFGHRDLARLLFFFLMFLPLTILVHISLHKRFVWTLLFCGTVILFVDLMIAVWLKQPLCLFLHVINISASVAACLLTAWFRQS